MGESGWQILDISMCAVKQKQSKETKAKQAKTEKWRQKIQGYGKMDLSRNLGKVCAGKKQNVEMHEEKAEREEKSSYKSQGRGT